MKKTRRRKKMTILTTGGAGYIGSHMVKRLCDLGHHVIVVDNLSTGHLEAIDARATFYQIDITNASRLDYVFMQQQIDAVIHFAAKSIVSESSNKKLEYYETNVIGTANLLDSMRKAGVKKLIFSSTAATYAHDNQMPLTEDSKANPMNYYGETKQMAEEVIKTFAKANELEYTMLRYFNVAGASANGLLGEDHVPETHLIPLVLQVALGNNNYVSVYGNDYPTIDGTCIRDYIHVEDLVEAHVLALNNKNGNQIYNIGTGNGYSVLEVIEAARKVTNHQIPIKYEARRVGDPAVLVASSGKIEQELGWTRTYTSIEDIIQSAWNFHQARPFGYKKNK
jgi:UDP-glucose 4-epimerase